MTGQVANKENIGAAIGRIPSGVFVITAKNSSGEKIGMLGSWVAQAGFEPPCVSVAVAPGPDVELIEHGAMPPWAVGHGFGGFYATLFDETHRRPYALVLPDTIIPCWEESRAVRPRSVLPGAPSPHPAFVPPMPPVDERGQVSVSFASMRPSARRSAREGVGGSPRNRSRRATAERAASTRTAATRSRTSSGGR